LFTTLCSHCQPKIWTLDLACAQAIEEVLQFVIFFLHSNKIKRLKFQVSSCFSLISIWIEYLFIFWENRISVHCKWVEHHWNRWRSSSIMGLFLQVMKGKMKHWTPERAKLVQWCLLCNIRLAWYENVEKSKVLSFQTVFVSILTMVMIQVLGELLKEYNHKCNCPKWDFCK